MGELPQAAGINRLTDPRKGAFGQPMLDQTENTVGELAKAGVTEPEAGQSAPRFCCGPHCTAS